MTSGCFSCRHNTSRFHPGTLKRLVTPHKIQAITSEGTYSGRKCIKKNKIILTKFNTKIPKLSENLWAVTFLLASPSCIGWEHPQKSYPGKYWVFFEGEICCRVSVCLGMFLTAVFPPQGLGCWEQRGEPGLPSRLRVPALSSQWQHPAAKP